MQTLATAFLVKTVILEHSFATSAGQARNKRRNGQGPRTVCRAGAYSLPRPGQYV